MKEDTNRLRAERVDPGGCAAFGSYVVDLRTQELWKEGIPIRIAGHPFQVLAKLLAHPGEMISREELQRQLWPDSTFTDLNHGLNAAVNKLRETLSDTAIAPRFIETLPRRGYRFIAPVQRAERPTKKNRLVAGGAESVSVVVDSDPPKIPIPLSNRIRFPRGTAWPALAAIAGFLAFGIGLFILATAANNREGSLDGRAEEIQVLHSDATPADGSTATELHSVVEPKAHSQHEVAQGSERSSPAKLRKASMTETAPTVRTIIGGNEGNAAPQFSPDGKHIAFMSNRSGPWQIWLSDIDGSKPRQLSFTASAGTPRWSPDSRSVAFDAPSDDGTSIYTVSIDRAEPARRLVEGVVPSFSRDGKWIYFASDRSGMWQVWRIPLAGGREEQVTRGGGFAALESDDGYIYFSKSRDQSPEICRIPVAGGKESCELPHLRPHTWSSWAVTRVGIVFAEDLPNGGSTLSLYQPAKREVRDLVSLQTVPMWLGASTDGRRAVINDTAERRIAIVDHLQ